MSEVDFLKDSHEISSSYSDSSEVGDLNIGCDFQNLHPYQIEPEKQNQTSSFQCGHIPDKVGKKSQPESLQNRVGNIGWCQCGKCHAETRDTDYLCCKGLVALDELKFEGKLFYVIF